MDEGSEIGSNSEIKKRQPASPPQQNKTKQNKNELGALPLLLEGSRFRTLTTPNAGEDVE